MESWTFRSLCVRAWVHFLCHAKTVFACPICFHGTFGRENAVWVFSIAFIDAFCSKVVDDKQKRNWAILVVTETMGEAAWTVISISKDLFELDVGKLA